MFLNVSVLNILVSLLISKDRHKNIICTMDDVRGDFLLFTFLILFKEGSFADVRTKDKQHIRRFDLYDVIYSRRHDNQILKRIQFKNESEEDNNVTCELCFPLTEDPTLHRKNLNLIQEWLLYVPLLLQTILGVFINKDPSNPEIPKRQARRLTLKPPLSEI